MNLKKIPFAIVLTITTAASYGRTLPHAELVSQYMHSAKYKEILAGCKTRPNSVSAASSSREVECWAASVANDLQQEPVKVTALVLNANSLESALSRCKVLSMEQRFKSEECAAAAHADDFISVRLPRTSQSQSLQPLTFKR